MRSLTAGSCNSISSRSVCEVFAVDIKVFPEEELLGATLAVEVLNDGMVAMVTEDVTLQTTEVAVDATIVAEVTPLLSLQTTTDNVSSGSTTIEDTTLTKLGGRTVSVVVTDPSHTV